METFRDQAWTIMRAATAPLTIREVVDQIGCNFATIERFFQVWAQRGHLERTPGRPARWTMTPKARPLVRPPLVASGGGDRREPMTARLWRAIRVMSRRGTFDAPLVAIVAGTTTAYALDFLNRLRRADYVRVIGKRWHGKPAAYRLIRDTGPIAPRIAVSQGRRILIDPNTGRRVDISPGRLSLRAKAASPTSGGHDHAA